MAQRVLATLLAALGGWLAFRLVGAYPLPDGATTLSFDALARWLGPLRPLALEPGELALVRRMLAGAALAAVAAIAWLEMRSFRLASQGATLRDRLQDAERRLESVGGSFRDLVERAHDFHYRHDLAGKLEWISESGLRLLGYAERDVAALSIGDVFEGDESEAIRGALELGAAGDRAGPRREVLARARDGRPIWLEVRARLVRRGDAPVGIEGVGIDVTPRKVAEVDAAIRAEISKALAETTSLEDGLAAVATVLCRTLGRDYGEVWWVDDQFDLVRMVASGGVGAEPAGEARPRSFSRGVGLPGRVWSQGQAIVAPDLASDPDPWCAKLAAAAPFREAVGIPIRLAQRVIGVVVLASARTEVHWAPLTVLDALGGQIGAVTDRRRAEEALKVSEARKQAVLETALDCVITADHEGRILEFNPAAELAFGVSREEALGRPMAGLIVPPALRQRHLDGFRACLETGRRPLADARIEVQAQRADGSCFPAELSIARIDVGRHPVFTAHVRDISERKAIDKLKDELVSTVSHELRTPLASIRGFVELMLMREHSDEERREFLGILDHEIRRLGKLIDDFLDIQRLEARGPDYKFEPLDLRAIVEHAATVVGATSARHALEVDLDARPLRVRGDRDRLGQAMMNLLSNAIKYSPEGGSVHVRAWRADGRTLVSVRDEGIGMAPETLEKLFTKFYRADNSATRGIGGTGLGLALVKEIARAHGGDVGAASELGKGSTFTLGLPLLDEDGGEDQ